MGATLSWGPTISRPCSKTLSMDPLLKSLQQPCDVVLYRVPLCGMLPTTPCLHTLAHALLSSWNAVSPANSHSSTKTQCKRGCVLVTFPDANLWMEWLLPPSNGLCHVCITISRQCCLLSQTGSGDQGLLLSAATPAQVWLSGGCGVQCFFHNADYLPQLALILITLILALVSINIFNKPPFLV